MSNPRVNSLKQSSGMYLTTRDREILHDIYRHDSLLTLEHIRSLHFPSQRTAYERMLKLTKFGYVKHPAMKIRMSLTDQVYWLTNSGAQIAAEVEGTPLESLIWTKKPRLDRLSHHIPLTNFRIKLTDEVKHNRELELLEWTGQLPFAQHTDQVEYTNLFGKRVKRFIEPDGLIRIHNPHTDNTLRALLELDRGNKDGVKIVNEKVLPTVSYFDSDLFQIRTGYNSGRMIFVVQSSHSEIRMLNLKIAVEKATPKNARAFWFTTYDAAMNAESILFDPIWLRGGSTAPNPNEPVAQIGKEVFKLWSLMLPG